MLFNGKKELLYLVTDRRYLKENESFFEVVEQSILGGVDIIQLREKELEENKFIDLSFKLKEITDKYNVPLIINDNVNVCKIVDASGVHIGNCDMPLKEAREILGKDKIIGVSVKTVENALMLEKQGASYFGVGAVNQTQTKLNAKPVTIETLKAICESVSIPVFAIGGIEKNNIENLKGTRINGVAVVSAILKARTKGKPHLA